MDIQNLFIVWVTHLTYSLVSEIKDINNKIIKFEKIWFILNDHQHKVVIFSDPSIEGDTTVSSTWWLRLEISAKSPYDLKKVIVTKN